MGVHFSGPKYRHGYITDTAILVQSDTDYGPSTAGQSTEEISLNLEVESNGTGAHLPRRLRRKSSNIDSPSECTTLSTVSVLTLSAPHLDPKYRYHLFFSYSHKNKPWVEYVIQKLEGDPYMYKCCYDVRDFDENGTLVQNIMCSVMLSEKIVVVLGPDYLESTWREYEETLSNMMSITQLRQRVILVILEDCEIPDSLKLLNYIDIRKDNFWDKFFRDLRNGCSLPYSDSCNTMWSITSQASGFNNGQVLATLNSTVQGWCKSHLLFDYDEVPDPLINQDIALNRQDYADIVKMVGREDVGQRLSWIYSALPTMALILIFILWCVAFILIIVLFPDDSPGTLPVRLCVFVLPAIILVLGCIIRWRSLRKNKERFSVCMFSRSVQVNKMLHERSKPVIVSTARTNDDNFHIYFVYFNSYECVEHIKMFLNHVRDEDKIKLSKLIEVYTLNSGYLEGRPIAERLAVMMSAAYCVQLVFRRLPHALEQRHSRRRQCLCQFGEEFLAAYLPCIRQESDINNLRFLFLRYLNCQFKEDPRILQTLGINLMTCKA